MHIIFGHFKGNIKPGLTVALVSIPLSISLAIAAGATPVAGIITAIWAGLFAAVFGGSRFNIVGPTGALSGVLATFVLLHGPEALPMLAIVTGLVTLLAYVFNWWKYLIFVPASVIHGFTLGVAFIIAFNQLNFALGLVHLPPQESLIMSVVGSFSHIAEFNPAATLLFIVGLIFLILWGKRFPKFPGAILLAAIGIVLGYLTDKQLLPFSLDTLYTKYGDLKATLFTLPSFHWSYFDRTFFVAVVSVALIGIIESLISAKIADGMTHTKSDKKKEILGLGLANIASGLAGGIPATAALARTALNVKSGADHQSSAVLNVFFVGLISLVLLYYFKFLPMPVVASVLVFVAINMVKHQHFSHMYLHEKTAFWMSLLVALITIIEDPLAGIIVGVALTMLIFVKRLSRAQSEITINKNNKLTHRVLTSDFMKLEEHGDILVYRFAGLLTYINSLSHMEAIEQIKKPHTVILALRNLFFMDIDGLDALKEMVEMLESRKINVIITGANDDILAVLAKESFFQQKQKEKAVFSGTAEALKSLDIEP